MGYLGADELANIRAHLKVTLPDTCTIQYPTWVSDGMGGGTHVWTARGTAIKCRLAPKGGGQAFITQAQVKEGMAWVLSLPHDQTVEVEDRVLVDSNTYQVTQVNVDESELGLKRVFVERLE